MKGFGWYDDKNAALLAQRSVCFEDVVLAIEQGRLLDVLEHPNQEKYGDQNIFLVHIQEYVWLVPFRETSDTIFLITIIPSRKATKKYLGELNEKKY